MAEEASEDESAAEAEDGAFEETAPAADSAGDGATADEAENEGIYRDKTINKQNISAAIGFFINQVVLSQIYAFRYRLIETELENMPTTNPAPKNDSKTVAASSFHGTGVMFSSAI